LISSQLQRKAGFTVESMEAMKALSFSCLPEFQIHPLLF
jgi:hypothetical protein